jgi:hypothetical protein
VAHTYTTEFYSVIRKNETISFEGKWIQLKDIMSNEVSQAQRETKAAGFLSRLGDRYNTNISNI